MNDGGIRVDVIKDSVSNHGNRLITIQSHYPRIIHSQRLKHRMHSINTSSSRAIPISSTILAIQEHDFIPVKFGKNQAGMVSGEEVDRDLAIDWWKRARDSAIEFAREGDSLKIHKEIVNRVMEPFMTVLEVSSGTEWNNLFHLRVADDAQGEINVWASKVFQAIQESEPMMIEHGEWHLPYVDSSRNAFGELRYYDISGKELDLVSAKSISTSCCAQASYRKLNREPVKAQEIYQKLMPEDGNLHATPTEHPATPMSHKEWTKRLIAAQMINDEIALFKGNVKGWIQHRKEFKNENNTSEFCRTSLGIN